MFRSTSHQTEYWKNRKVDWVTQYQKTADHPHRKLISGMLKTIPFVSLWEVGVGGGANLVRIIIDHKGKQLGGSDVSPTAIEACQKAFLNGIFRVEPGDNLLMSDKSVDVLLTDMMLIYVDPRHIDNYLREFKRVTRNYVVFCEFHSRSFWERLKARFRGYHVYDYQQRLEKLGFFNIQVQHIPPEWWPGTDKNTEFRSIITARV